MKTNAAERICNSLRSAFPKLEQRADLHTLTHEGCLYMRSRLASISDRDLPYYLVQVLVDAINTHTGDFSNPEDVEDLVRYLDTAVEGVDPSLFKGAVSKKQTSKITSDRKHLAVVK